MGCTVLALKRTAFSTSNTNLRSPLTYQFQYDLYYSDIKTQHPLEKGGELKRGENVTKALASRSRG